MTAASLQSGYHSQEVSSLRKYAQEKGVKVHVFWEGHFQNQIYGGDFAKFWPSQNVWTLNTSSFVK